MRIRYRAQPLLVLAVLLSVVAAPAFADDSTARYVEAIHLHNAGKPDAALEALEQLASEVPASIPVHRALALVALERGKEQTAAVKTKLWRRLRRTRRDVGASVGRAIILNAEGRKREAHTLLISALTCGARHPLLVALLAETSYDPAGFTKWLDARARALGRDSAFAALRVRYLLSQDQTQKAQALLKTSIARYPQDPDLLALHAEWLRADGRANLAARQAALAVGLLAGRHTVPELRVPRRLKLARALIAGGELGEARALLGALGPLASLEGDRAFEPVRHVVEAELALALHEPLRAIALLENAHALPPDWQEAARSIRARARVSTGLGPAEDTASETTLPRGMALADRSITLASRVRDQPGPEQREKVERLSDALFQAGLTHRAAHLSVLAVFLRGDSDPARQQLRAILAHPVGEDPEQPSAVMVTAASLIKAGWAARRGDHESVLEAARLSTSTRSASPGRLLATLRLLASRAAFYAGDFEETMDFVREGLLDLQEADMSPLATPVELIPVEEAFGDASTELPGIAFAAELAHGVSPARAGSNLLRNLSRATRSWSTLGTSWSGRLDEVLSLIGAKACLVLATPEALAPALAVRPGMDPATAPRAEILESEPCGNARTIYWLGPAAPPGGLSPAPGDERILLRLVAPTPISRRGIPYDGELSIREVGPGLDGPLRRSVESALERVESSPQGISRAVARLDETWPVFHGTGIASSRSPLSSGWLVPESMNSRGWLGPEDLSACTPTNGSGLVAVGLTTLPAPATRAEKGAWLLAEEALASGHPWALLSRHPLSEALRLRLIDSLPDWREAPLEEVLRTIREDPELAEALTLWTTPGVLEEPKVRVLWPWFATAAVILFATAAFWRRRRLRSRSRAAGSARTERGSPT